MEPSANKRVLDPCCGGRMMWFDRQHPDVVFGDRRTETITVTDRSHGNNSGQRVINIAPDTLMDFRALPYPDGTFKLVSFDPPHLVRAGPKSWLAAKYGKLGEDWREDLRTGFFECFRVLATDGVLVFKWNETQVKLSEVLALTPHQPLFGNTSGKKGWHTLAGVHEAGQRQRGGLRVTCNQHALIELVRLPRGEGPDIETVIRWCRVCGCVVGDVDVDGRTQPGAHFKMIFPKDAQ